MEKDRKFRALAIAAICIAVVGVSVAYAALTASLTITGTATVEAATWDIYWDNESGEVANEETADLVSVEADGRALTFAVKFTAPGDKATIRARVVNNGTLKAKLDSGNTIVATDNATLAGYIDAQMEILPNGTDEGSGLSVTNAQGKALKANTGTADYVDVVITLTLLNTDDEAVWAEIAAASKANGVVTYTANLDFVQGTDADTNYFNPGTGA